MRPKLKQRFNDGRRTRGHTSHLSNYLDAPIVLPRGIAVTSNDWNKMKHFSGTAVLSATILVAASCESSLLNQRKNREPSKPTDDVGLPGYIVQDVPAGEPAVLSGADVRIVIQAGSTSVDTQVRLKRLSASELPESDQVVLGSREAVFHVEMVDTSSGSPGRVIDLQKPLIVERNLADGPHDGIVMALVSLAGDGEPVARYQYPASEIQISAAQGLSVALLDGMKALAAVQETHFLFGFGVTPIEDDRYLLITSPAPITAIEAISKKTATQVAAAEEVDNSDGDGDGDGGVTVTPTSGVPNSGWGTHFKLVDSLKPAPYSSVITNDGVAMFSYPGPGGIWFRRYDLKSGIRSAEQEIFQTSSGFASLFLVDDSRAVIYYAAVPGYLISERVIPLSTFVAGPAKQLLQSLGHDVESPIFIGGGKGVFVEPGFSEFTVDGDYLAPTASSGMYGKHCAYSSHDEFIYCHSGADTGQPTKLSRCSVSGSCSDSTTFDSGLAGTVRVLSSTRLLVVLTKAVRMFDDDVVFVEWDLVSGAIVDQKTYAVLQSDYTQSVGVTGGRIWGFFLKNGKILQVGRSASGQWMDPAEVPGNPIQGDGLIQTVNVSKDGHGFIAWRTAAGDLFASTLTSLESSAPIKVATGVGDLHPTRSYFRKWQLRDSLL